MPDQVVVPAWAETINVRRRRNSLIVVGRRRYDQPTGYASRLTPSPKGLFRSSGPVIWERRFDDAIPPHLEFVRATSTSKQEEFVRKYGPVNGTLRRVVKDKEREEITAEIRAEQQLETLQTEQARFSLLSHLVSELKQTKLNYSRLGSLIMDLEAETPFEIGQTGGEAAMLTSEFAERSVKKTFETLLEDGDLDQPKIEGLFILQSAHLAIAKWLNKYPPYVTFFAGQPAELPLHQPQGILPALYFLLRRDYLSSRRCLAECALEDCGIVFPVTRSGQRFCCPEHSRLQRGRDYWRRRGNKRRLQRKKLQKRRADA